ncbi:hypothetical protein BGX27_003175, partial [Mortierella sp. AM989]
MSFPADLPIPSSSENLNLHDEVDDFLEDASGDESATSELPKTALQRQIEKEASDCMFDALEEASTRLDSMNLGDVNGEEGLDDLLDDISISAGAEIQATEQAAVDGKSVIKALQKELEEKFTATLWDVVARSLFEDRNIVLAAASLQIEPEHRITRSREGVLEFFLPDGGVKDWITAHENHLGISFILARPAYSYTDRDTTLERTVYNCHRSRAKYTDPKRVPGGKSGKIRKSRQSVRIGCKATFSVVKQRRVTDSGTITINSVTYDYRHNHSVGMKNQVGTQRKSDILKRRIADYVRQGRTIQNIMHRLSIDQDRFLRATEGDGPRVIRDDIITYEDVYNILYKINNKKARKHQDPIVSANMWMEDLERNGYFTFHDPQGQYYGFSSPWQLDQLRSYGEVFCFDGTHEVFG